LHYDLRLEIEGALGSWALPQGPSYDRRRKRLAVQTEDHPLGYAQFEGRIPDQEYGGGDSLVWDRGTYHTDPPGQEQAQREKGHLRLVLEGDKLRGVWHLVRTGRVDGRTQWLFFKAKDEQAQPERDIVTERPESVVSGRRVVRGPVNERTLRARHPEPIGLLVRVWPPVQAREVWPGDVEPGSFLEPWLRGHRALASLSGQRVALQSEEGRDLVSHYTGLARDLAGIRVGEAVLDGVVVDDGAGGAYFAFDLLWLEGEDLRSRPIEERRDLLESVLAHAGPCVQPVERLPKEVAKADRSARKRGWVGLIAKAEGSRYEEGAWRKVALR